MTKNEAIEIMSFVESHYDYVNQEDWFWFSWRLMDMALDSANRHGFAEMLVEEFPRTFKVKED